MTFCLTWYRHSGNICAVSNIPRCIYYSDISFVAVHITTVVALLYIIVHYDTIFLLIFKLDTCDIGDHRDKVIVNLQL